MKRLPALARFLATDGRGIAIVALGVAALLVGRLLRYGWIEPEAVAARCEASPAWWCGLRTGLIVLTQWHGLGWAALGLCGAGGVWMLMGRSGRVWWWASLAVAGLALALYNATHGAIAMVAAALLLLAAPKRPDHP
jgi:hypothetical protein